MTTTPSDILSLALLDAGIIGQGQTASAEDINNAFTRLNYFMAQLVRKRWLVYNLVTLDIVSTGAQSYTIGPGGDIDTARPDKIESAFLRQTNVSPNLPVDYPLEIIAAREDYNRIRLKTLTSFSGSIFYDSGWPIGTLFPWPIPLGSIYSLFVSVKQPIAQFTSESQDINLPPEYEELLYTNMVVRLRAAYQLPPDPVYIGLAKDSMNVVRQANAQIPRLTMPAAVTRTGPWYSIQSDLP